MNIQVMTSFFMWCTIINSAFMGLIVLLFQLCPEFVYRTQNRFFPIPRETYNVLIYGFLGMFKLFVIVFNLVPFVALLIVG